MKKHPKHLKSDNQKNVPSNNKLEIITYINLLTAILNLLAKLLD